MGKKANPDPLEDTFQTVDLSQEDAWRTNQQAEYINIPELPEEPALTNGTAHSGEVEVEPVEYSYPPAPPRLPPKRPAAPVIDAQVTVDVPELAAAVQAPEVEVEVSAAAAPDVEVEKPEVEVEVETPGEVEIPAAAEAELAVAVETPDVAVETPEVAVETPEVAVETPQVEPEVETPEVEVETPEVKVAAPEIPAENVEVDVEVSGAIGGAAVAVGTAEVTGEVEKEVEVEVQSEEAEMFAGVQTPTEKEELQSDSGDDLSPEEVQQKLAALGEPLSDENNESDEEEEEPLSPSRMRFEASVSMLESVPEDEDGGSESEEESEGSSVGEAGGKHTNVGNDNDDVTAL